MKPDVVIPAFNEDQTIGDIVRVFRRSGEVGRIIVVDNASTDDTYRVAVEAGATRVVKCKKPGKGEAVTKGLKYVKADRVIFCDADLVNLDTSHVRLLAMSSRGMRVGIVDMSREFCGIRSLPASLARRANLSGYSMEAALNIVAQRLSIPIDYVRLERVHQWWWVYIIENRRMPEGLKFHPPLLAGPLIAQARALNPSKD